MCLLTGDLIMSLLLQAKAKDARTNCYLLELGMQTRWRQCVGIWCNILLCLSLGTCAPSDSSIKRSHPGRRHPSMSGTSRCNAPRVALPSWGRIDIAQDSISLLLPPRATRIEVTPEDSAPGETWRAGNLTILYRIRKRTAIDTTHSVNLADYTFCSDTIAGRQVNIISYYSTATTLPGQFVFAFWPTSGGRDVMVHAQSPNKTSVDTLTAIVRWLRFYP